VPEDTTTFLVNALDSKQSSIKIAALDLISKRGPLVPSALPALKKLLETEDPADFILIHVLAAIYSVDTQGTSLDAVRSFKRRAPSYLRWAGVYTEELLMRTIAPPTRHMNRVRWSHDFQTERGRTLLDVLASLQRTENNRSRLLEFISASRDANFEILGLERTLMILTGDSDVEIKGAAIEALAAHYLKYADVRSHFVGLFVKNQIPSESLVRLKKSNVRLARSLGLPWASDID
jgi:hypothetical protein